MIIHLPSIPEEGQDFEFSHQDKDLANELKSSIGQEELEVKFHIRPLGEAYEMKGSLKTKAPLDCSFCGEAYAYSIKKDFTEFLVPNRSKGKKIPAVQKVDPDQNAAWQEDQVEGIHGEKFHVFEYLHELIDFQIPFQVPCENQLDSCDNYKSIQKYLANSPKAPEPQKESPFSSLKKLQIDKKH